MKEKEKRILEAGMKLFARKGVIATSIQEIATESGISKGSFYLYFESKEALMLAIFNYYYDQIQNRITEVALQYEEPKERFIQQLRIQLEEIAKHKEFIVIHAREHAIPFNAEIAKFIHAMREDAFTFYHSHLTTVYGERVERYATDLTMLLQGMLHTLLEMIILQEEELDLHEAAAYLVQRVEHLLEGFERTGEKTLFKLSSTNMMCLSLGASPQDPKPALLRELRILLDEASLTANDEHLVVTLEVLLEELSASEPRQPIVEGMLYNLRHYDMMEKLVESIRTLFCTSAASRSPIKS
ncbi:TetR/AcrR family transcriptional regulator [Paenibacillus sp. 481]|uniref:TetR/AcrR family transcriptional regulator n=1 Tax=Paenibacillus sp. 481 TaxID=2835869 RepID=UPI001E3C843E|nr:TetR/AcrR family transcriptional regulator [Paenibacillus sp. 481]UHA75263.1 TetR/AcrR family transcriptional regulator [Paenibacillus sp. 481]